MKQVKTLTPFDLHRSILPAIFLSSQMFSPKQNGNSNRKPVFFTSVRNKSEKLTFIGYEFDCDLDFRIYALIISKSLLRDDFSINLTISEFFDVLNTHKSDRHIAKFEKYIKRLDLFKKSKFMLEHYINDVTNRQDLNLGLFKYKEKSYNLIDDYAISNDKKSVKIYLNYDIKSDFFGIFEKEIVDLDKFSAIEDQNSKSLYLLFLTKKFKNNSFFYVSKNELYNRISIYTKISDSKMRSLTDEILKKLLKQNFYLKFESYNDETFIFYK